MSLHIFYSKENDTYGAMGTSIHAKFFKEACSKDELIEWMDERAIPHKPDFSNVPIQSASFIYQELRANLGDYAAIGKAKDIGISEKELHEILCV